MSWRQRSTFFTASKKSVVTSLLQNTSTVNILSARSQVRFQRINHQWQWYRVGRSDRKQWGQRDVRSDRRRQWHRNVRQWFQNSSVNEMCAVTDNAVTSRSEWCTDFPPYISCSFFHLFPSSFHHPSTICLSQYFKPDFAHFHYLPQLWWALSFAIPKRLLYYIYIRPLPWTSFLLIVIIRIASTVQPSHPFKLSHLFLRFTAVSLRHWLLYIEYSFPAIWRVDFYDRTWSAHCGRLRRNAMTGGLSRSGFKALGWGDDWRLFPLSRGRHRYVLLLLLCYVNGDWLAEGQVQMWAGNSRTVAWRQSYSAYPDACFYI